MLSRFQIFFERLSEEPPFRLITRTFVKYLPTSTSTKAKWDAVERPHYLMGIVRAAQQAKRQNQSEICVAEFGVARGDGLLLLQKYAEGVERETGIKIWVYGFDTGSGLPELCGDYRDHPDFYRIGDYPTDLDALRRNLTDRTQLIIGNVSETVDHFVKNAQRGHLGFASIDVDFYTSTRDALKILSHTQRKLLNRVVLYFDELDLDYFHEYAGEFLAIREFNAEHDHVKIDKWHGVTRGRPFPENIKLLGMYVAHDLEAISKTSVSRNVASRAT
jgi:hypothetical protein